MTSNDTPTYNLKAVVQETGLKPDTLRAWERRYGVPEPERTGGGHRLYSQQDINTLKWLLARQDEGMSISRAVGLWHSLLAEARDPLQVYPLARAMEPAAAYTPVEMGDTVIELRRAWVAACLAFDERRAEMVLNQAFSYYSPEVVCFELLQKALAEVGNEWYKGAISVQQEHFMSALAVRRLDALLAATPPPTRTGRLLVGCAPGENHTFSPLLVSLLLRRRGWDVIYLGADVPIFRLQATIETTQPSLVIFSAQLLDTAATLLDVARYLHEIDVPLAYGGYIFGTLPDLTRRIPGHFLGYQLNQIPQVIEHLLANQPPLPATEPPSDDYRQAWAYFRERLGLIETDVWEKVAHPYSSGSDIIEAIHYLTRNILSALYLGDLDYIGSNLAWIEGMMVNHNLPMDDLHYFLSTYRTAAKRYLTAPAGRPILEWLERIAAEAGAAATPMGGEA